MCFTDGIPMGSGNSTDSVSFGSNMGYRIRAGLRRFTRRVVLAVERVVGRPISKTTKYELMMSATSRSSFAWAPAAREEEVKEGPNL